MTLRRILNWNRAFDSCPAGKSLLARRPILVYLIVIAVPLVILMLLGLQSVQRQHEALQTLRATTLRLSGEKLTAEMEQASLQAAAACLSEAAGIPFDPSNLPAYRGRLAELQRSHPIARHFFLLAGERIIYPRLHAPLSQPLETFLENRRSETERINLSIMEESERQELRNAQFGEALSGYRRVFEARVPPALKALALSRIARCLRKMDRHAEADQAYRQLLESYPDEFDPAHRPYGILAALELGQDAARRAVLRREIREGRWDLSAGQMEFFLNRLGGASEEDIPSYMLGLRLARSVEDSFRHYGQLEPGRTYYAVLKQGNADRQIFYGALPGSASVPRLLGFAADQDWIEGRLLSECRQRLGISENVTLSGANGDAAEPRAVRVRFSQVFPFLSVSLQLPDEAPRWDLWIHGGATTLMLVLLVFGVILLMRDVRRELHISQMRAEFVSGVSHELRTPLTLIRLYSETLSQGSDPPPEERKRFCGIITRESERLTHLIEKVLAFSQADSGQKEYRLQEGDPAPVIARTVEAYRQHLERRGFQVEMEIAQQLPHVRFDADAISQAVVNLLDNAWKYSGDSRTIAIRLASGDGNVVFEVEDHGIGIPAGERDRIFQRFYRGSNAAAQGGYSLGLFMVKHIMDEHGGTISVESEPGRRTVFRLAFPAMPGRGR